MGVDYRSYVNRTCARILGYLGRNERILSHSLNPFMRTLLRQGWVVEGQHSDMMVFLPTEAGIAVGQEYIKRVQ